MAAPIICWRIASDTLDYGADDLTGRGAELSGGRWNRAGTPMLYASESRALACLESLVHVARAPLPLNRYLVQLTLPDDLWAARQMFDPDANVGWDAEPAGYVSLEWGTGWVRSRSSVIAEVPSVIVPEERNVLLNPLAPGFERVEARKVRRWLCDRRLR